MQAEMYPVYTIKQYSDTRSRPQAEENLPVRVRLANSRNTWIDTPGFLIEARDFSFESSPRTKISNTMQPNTSAVPPAPRVRSSGRSEEAKEQVPPSSSVICTHSAPRLTSTSHSARSGTRRRRRRRPRRRACAGVDGRRCHRHAANGWVQNL